MKRAFAAVWLGVVVIACSDGTEDVGIGGSGASGNPSSGDPTSQSTGTSPSSGGQGPSSGGGGTGGDLGGGGNGGGTAEDPAGDGPFTVTSIMGTAKNAVSTDTFPVKAYFPSAGPEMGPFPVVLMAHGFQIAATQYDDYVRRLATFGYVAINVDYSASFVGLSNVENANDLVGAIDWAGMEPQLVGKADTSNVGASGHSMGGKLALLAATLDGRIKASITLDPVDGAMNCNAQNCPDVSDKLPMLQIPTAFVGETTDMSGGMFGMPCAPAANNFTTFFASANAPSLSVNVLGANHMSFIQDPGSCLVCGFCNAATASQAQVLGIAKSYVVAFYERHLKGKTSYETYLDGAIANQRYVATNQVTLQSK